jgi:hypothetical protein
MFSLPEVIGTIVVTVTGTVIAGALAHQTTEAIAGATATSTPTLPAETTETASARIDTLAVTGEATVNGIETGAPPVGTLAATMTNGRTGETEILMMTVAEVAGTVARRDLVQDTRTAGVRARRPRSASLLRI